MYLVYSRRRVLRYRSRKVRMHTMSTTPLTHVANLFRLLTTAASARQPKLATYPPPTALPSSSVPRILSASAPTTRVRNVPQAVTPIPALPLVSFAQQESTSMRLQMRVVSVPRTPSPSRVLQVERDALNARMSASSPKLVLDTARSVHSTRSTMSLRHRLATACRPSIG